TGERGEMRGRLPVVAVQLEMVVAERVDGHEDQVGRVARGAPFGRRRIHRRRAGRRRPPAGKEHRHDGRAHEDADHGPSEKPPRDGRGDQTRGHAGYDAGEAGDGRPTEHEQEAFAETLARLEADVETRAVVLTGHGEFFSAGLDLKVVPTYGPEQQRTMVMAINRLLGRLYGLGLPAVAAVNGHAIAGGLVVVL